MDARNQAPKLSLKKETITKLSDEQMKKVIGGTGEVSSSTQPTQSCNRQSCNSAGSGSCGDNSCNCVADATSPVAGTAR